MYIVLDLTLKNVLVLWLKEFFGELVLCVVDWWGWRGCEGWGLGGDPALRGESSTSNGGELSSLRLDHIQASRRAVTL